MTVNIRVRNIGEGCLYLVPLAKHIDERLVMGDGMGMRVDLLYIRDYTAGIL